MSELKTDSLKAVFCILVNLDKERPGSGVLSGRAQQASSSLSTGGGASESLQKGQMGNSDPDRGSFR